jgi:sterol desaturase/sphingolipid hydroxylase (fatty acid hydroxylase superfamily)
VSDAPLAAVVAQSRAGIAALALAVLWTVESVAPMFAGRRRRWSHGFANLALAALNGGVAYLFANAVLDVTEWSRTSHVGLLHRRELPVWVHGVLALLLFDAWQYGWHRLNHRVRFLWRFHAVHHADGELDVTSGVRFHTVEIVLSFAARLVVLPLIGMTGVELLLYEAIALPIIFFHHSNVAIPGRVDAVLRLFIVTPWMHYVHHSRLQPETDSNYASLLSIWDRLFGSFRLRARPHEIALGLDGWSEPDWRTVPGMLAAPFLRRRRGPP